MLNFNMPRYIVNSSIQNKECNDTNVKRAVASTGQAAGGQPIASGKIFPYFFENTMITGHILNFLTQ